MDGLDQPHAGRLEDIPAAAGLLDHIVSRFHEDGNLNVLSSLWGPLLLEEIVYWVRSPPPRSVPMPRELRSLTDYIKANLGSSLSLSDLAAQSGKSRSTVGRLFRRHLECSPVEWMLKLKMDRAAEFLRTRKLTAAEAGYQVGINDPSYFNRCFRRRHGVAPGTRRGRIEINRSSYNLTQK